MNEYLFELDSVCNSEEEVKIGQEALFEAVAQRGSRVVLSYNQLVDSAAFWAALNCAATRDAMLRLCEGGRICVNLYDGDRTASQYVVARLNGLLAGTPTRFISSYLAIGNGGQALDETERDLAQRLRDAICYSDPEIFDECTDSRSEKFKTYAKGILALSKNVVAVQEDGQGQRSFSHLSELLACACERLGASGGRGLIISGDVPLSQAAGMLMGEVLAELRVAARRNPDSRSVWYAALKRLCEDDPAKTDVAKAVEAVVDIGYNFVIEDSMVGIKRRYQRREGGAFWETSEDFWGMFQQSLSVYWSRASKVGHLFFCEAAGVPSVAAELDAETVPDWAFAAEVIERNVAHLAKHPNSGFERYLAKRGLVLEELDFEERRAQQESWWEGLLRKSRVYGVTLSLARGAAYVVFCWFIGGLEPDLTTKFHGVVPVFLIAVLTVFVFEFLMDLIGKFVDFPSLVDVVTDTCRGFFERGRLAHYGHRQHR